MRFLPRALGVRLLVAVLAAVGCHRRARPGISSDPTPSVADVAASPASVSFMQATFAANPGVDVSLSWPFLFLPSGRGTAMSSTMENALRADVAEVEAEHGEAVIDAGPAGGLWLRGWFVHIVCKPTLVAPDLVSVACRHAWNRGNVPDDDQWFTTYAWSAAKGMEPLTIEDVVGAEGRTELGKLAWTSLKESGETSVVEEGYTADDVARNDLGVFAFDRDGVIFPVARADTMKGRAALHLDWSQVRAAAQDPSIVDRLETAAHDRNALTPPLVAPFDKE